MPNVTLSALDWAWPVEATERDYFFVCRWIWYIVFDRRGRVCKSMCECRKPVDEAELTELRDERGMLGRA